MQGIRFWAPMPLTKKETIRIYYKTKKVYQGRPLFWIEFPKYYLTLVQNTRFQPRLKHYLQQSQYSLLKKPLQYLNLSKAILGSQHIIYSTLNMSSHKRRLTTPTRNLTKYSFYIIRNLMLVIWKQKAAEKKESRL